MAGLCKDPSELWENWEKVMDRWESSKTIKKWGFTGDTKFFKELWFDATEKDFELGVDINNKDLRKFEFILEEKIKHLKSPGDMAHKFKKIMWVGYAKAMKNPITKGFFHTLSDAAQFRHRVTAQNMSQYKDIMADLKDAVALNEGQNDIKSLMQGKIQKSKFDILKDKLESYEKGYVDQMINENMSTKQNASDHYSRLKDFLEGEGAVFDDFVKVLDSGSSKVLEIKYKNDIELKRTYINKINNAATKWNSIVKLSHKELNQAINNLIDVVDMKYGNRSKVASKLIEQYREVQANLKKGVENDKGYVPHYVLDLLKQTMEMRDRIDLNRDLSSKEMDNILNGYTDQVSKINVQLSPRLKSKSKSNLPTEYFTRNPVLYITQFVKDVAKFNYNTYVDRAYLKGMHKLSEVVFSNPGDKTAEAAEAYSKYLKAMYTETTTGQRLEDSSAANNLHRMISSWQFISKLGLNVRSPIRNLSQSLFTWKWFGRDEAKKSIQEMKDNPEYYNLLNTAIDKFGLKYYDLGTVTEGAVSNISLEGFGISYKEGYLTRQDQVNVLDQVTRLGVKGAEKTAFMMKWAENFNRKHTFTRAFGSRMRQLRQQSQYSDYKNPKIQEEMAGKAGRYAARITELLHFQYGKHGKSELLKHKVGSLMFQFQHYSKSAIALEAMIYKDYYKAIKAGDYGGYEARRVGRSLLLVMAANLVSIPFHMNMTSYFGNEIIGKISEFVHFLTGDEDERKNAFYGKGPIVSQSVVLSDMVELFNLGLSAGYYNLQADPDGMASLLTGIREYEDVGDADFLRGVAGTVWSEGERFATKTLPALTKSGIVGFARAQFGLYPGETELGIPVRKARKAVMESETMQDASDVYEKAFGTGLVKKSNKNKKHKLKPAERKKALQSLYRF